MWAGPDPMGQGQQCGSYSECNEKLGAWWAHRCPAPLTRMNGFEESRGQAR